MTQMVKRAERFDPLRDVMLAQSSKPPELSNVDLRSLTPFQRALLVLDGTVTKFIEAYTLEPLEIVRLDQATQVLPKDHYWLAAPKGTEVGLRQVLIRSESSLTAYAYAVSLLVFERLPDRVRYGIEIQGEGIGRLLNDSELETRREVLWYGKEHLPELPEMVRESAGSDFISRTYRIISKGQPIALINEKFPLALNEQPAPDQDLTAQAAP
jgi:chorismate-pyruvate lyase